MRRFILFLVATLATANVAYADYAVLRSGQRLHITGYERIGGMMRLSIAGGTIEVPADDVVRVEPEEVFLVSATPAPSGPFDVIIRRAAQKHGLSEALIASIVAAESNFNPRAVSRKHALGLMQLMPQTAARFSVANAFDPSQNIDAGSRYFKELLETYHGDVTLALAAYNAGPRRVEQFGGVPPFHETRNYVRRVTADFEQRKKNSGGAPYTGCISFAIPCAPEAPRNVAQ